MNNANLAHINPAIITWALKRRGLTRKEIATKQLTAEQIKAWEDGLALPTHTQAEVLADKLRIPFLLLFLSEFPTERLEIPDLRTVSGIPESPPSLEFLEVINDALVRQDWYRELQRSNSSKRLPFVGSFATNLNVDEVSKDIQAAMSMETLRRASHSWRDFLDRLIATVEQMGILVFRSAIVRHSTNKKLLVKEFRGFVLSDELAPLIFINDEDAKAAQTFTLVHELAHIWIGQTGISDPHFAKRSNDLANSIERFCNRVAAEVLVPIAEFTSGWDGRLSVSENVSQLAIRFRVSSLVILIRARDVGKLSDTTFETHYNAAMQWFRQQDMKDQTKTGDVKKRGGQFWYSFVIRNSKRFADSVVGAAKEGRTRYTEAAGLLGVNTATFERYIARLQKAN
jgi:Zn-dependent peptidase ImmA (M78 family)